MRERQVAGIRAFEDSVSVLDRLRNQFGMVRAIKQKCAVFAQSRVKPSTGSFSFITVSDTGIIPVAC